MAARQPTLTAMNSHPAAHCQKDKLRTFFANLDHRLLDTPTPAEMRERVDTQLAKWKGRSWWEVEQAKNMFVLVLEKKIKLCRDKAVLLGSADMQQGLQQCGYPRLRKQLLEHAQVLEEQLPRLRSAPCVHC